MAPIKFEEHIKEKLDQRRIQPSVGSWEKLNARLDNTNRKPGGKKWWIPSIAAVIVVLIASILFIGQQNQNSAPIVETPLESNIGDQSGEVEFEQTEEIASEKTTENHEPNIQPSVKANSEEKVAESKPVEMKKAERLAFNMLSERNLVKAVSITAGPEKPVVETDISVRMQELLAKISQFENTSGERMTDAEVDALLADAVSQIRENRSLYAGTKVSASSLLVDVEFEVNQSFRKEVFDFLKEEFLKAKSAVATRND